MTGVERPEMTVQYDFDAPAAPDGAWRSYDPDNPDPRYFEFDWISARHPDLYHQFALSTDGLMKELPEVVDLTGCRRLRIRQRSPKRFSAASTVQSSAHT